MILLGFGTMDEVVINADPFKLRESYPEVVPFDTFAPDQTSAQP